MSQDRPGNSPDGGVRTSLRIILEIRGGSLEDCSADGLPDQGVSSNGANRPKLQTWLNVAPFGQPGIGG